MKDERNPDIRNKPRYGLVLDDNSALASLLGKHLEDRGYEVAICFTCGEARTVLDTKSFDLVFLDYHLPDGVGFDLVQTLLLQTPRPSIFLMSGSDGVPLENHAREMGVEGFVRKPLSLDRIDALLTRRLRSQNHEHE